MTTESLDVLIGELAALLSPVGRALQSPNGLNRLLAELGVASTSDDPLMPSLDDPIPAASNSGLVGALTQIAAIEREVQALIEEPGASLDIAARALDLTRQAVTSISSASSAISSLGIDGLGGDFLDLLITGWLANRHPLLRHVAILLTLIQAYDEQDDPPPVVSNDGSLVRLPFRVDRVHFSRLADLLRDPLGTLRAEYANALLTEDDADAVAQKLFPRLQNVLRDLGISTHWGINPIDQSVLGDAAPIMARSLIVYTDDLLNGADQEAGFVVTLSPASQGDLGVVISPFGTLTFNREVGHWTVAAQVTAEVDVAAWGRQGVTLLAGAGTTEFAAGLSATLPKPDDGPAYVLGSPTGTRLEIGSVRFGLDARLSESTRSLGLSADFTNVQFVLAPGDADGFLGSILPADGVRAKASLGITWSSRTGLALRGSASLDATLPIGLSIGGISVPSVRLAIAAQSGEVRAALSASVSASIGPVRALADGIGISSALTFPGGGGNVGFADLALGLQGPSGIALSVDAEGVVSGSGFLFHDPTQGTYVGALQLTLHESLTLTAIGLIATRLADGSRGYSLLVFITAEDFKPIPLGLGFTLQGIGGLVAINRTFDETVIRAGLQNDTLKTLLFPKDPVTNATAIVRTLESAFPARQGSYLLGLLARICWGTPTLLQFDLALILELGARERLLALGRITAVLPAADNDLLRLKLDALGVLDFDAGTVALDAVLVDSRLVRKFAITGAGALRAGWGAGAGHAFVLAVGGFNPRFAPPAGVPALARVGIALSSGDNPRLSCEAYFALTSNTVQFGARAQLYASAIGFALVGDVGFDVLFDSPVHFVADFYASVQLKRGSTNLFKVAVAGTLEGLLPLRMSGKASFEILWCDFTVRFHATLVDAAAPTAAAVDVEPLLVAALADAGSWSTQAPTGTTHGVALRKVAPTVGSGVLVLDPLGRLAVTQRVVPLATGRDIEVFHGAPVSGARRFTVTAALSGSGSGNGNGAPPTVAEATTSDFAPAQFFSMTEDEKLASPSFEAMQAGLVIGTDAVTLAASQLVAAPLTYESFVIDALPAPEPAVGGGTTDVAVTPTAADPYVLPAAQLAVHAATGAAARAPARRVGRARWRVAGPPQVELTAPKWAVVAAATGAALPVDAGVTTWSDYRAVATTLNRSGTTYDVVAVA